MTKKEMTKNANGVEPDHLTVMKVTHTSKKTGRIENKKIEAVVNSVEDMIDRRITQLTAEGSSISSLPTEEINNLVYETTEKEKGRVLGLGTLPKTQKLVSSFVSFTSNQELQNKILELQEADAAKACEIEKMRAQMDAATAKTAEIDMLRAQVEADATAREEMLTWLRTNHNYPK